MRDERRCWLEGMQKIDIPLFIFMKWKIYFLLVMMLVQCFVPCVFAADSDQADAKARKIIEEGKIDYSDYALFEIENREFCELFLQDFTDSKEAIEYIMPLTISKLQDRILQKYFKKCPDAMFEKTYIFKLFKVNITNNEKNREDYVLYQEGYKNKADDHVYGVYTIIDFNRCDIKGGGNQKS